MFLYIIIMWLDVIGLSTRVRVSVVRPEAAVTLRGQKTLGASLSGYLIYSLVLVSVRSAQVCVRVCVCEGVCVCVYVCVPPRGEASHDAGLDVLVGDLLVVIVGAATRGVHGRGRHGVEGEHELLSVAHARRLGVVPGNTL